MGLGKYKSLILSLTVGGVLSVGLLLLLNGVPRAARAAPDALFVKPNGTDTECSQANPCALQTALARAQDGDTIYLAGGTYTGTGETVITLTKSLTLYGGWDGSPTGPIMRNPGVYSTVLDGEGERRVAYISSSITVTLDGLTITNGWHFEKGAGLFVANSSYLTLRRTTVYSNVVYSASGANTYGGGAYVFGASLHVISSTFRANDAWCAGCPSSNGGGLYIYSPPTATIEYSLFEANDAWVGSGVYFDGGTLSPLLVRYTVFRDNGRGLNPGSGFGGYGGGAYIGLADARFESCQFLYNTAGNSGGALYFSGRQLLLTRSMLRGNMAHVAAGIDMWNTVPFTIVNSIIADNWPGYTWAGGIKVESSEGKVLHTTIARNVGPYGGYGVEVRSGNVITLVDTILVSHTVGISVAVGSAVTLEGTLWGSGPWANGTDWAGDGTIFTGTVNIWGDPAFVDPNGGDYHIGPGSAAINAGVNGGVSTDIDGDPRPIGAGYDVGADEYIARVYLPLIMKGSP